MTSLWRYGGVRDPKRIELFCRELMRYWMNYPDLRFGQIVENLKRRMGKEDIFFVEDDEMLEELKKMFAN